ncbi:unnamed protein product [Calicophoron daubneyi]|uniref:2',3'-cyclic-nucleotide 3'-phosphodiesterase n=1 Tax=Calicophoron daubneyi TaxID=300641 RepID=A0AAV2SYL6_CALDB
MGNVFVHLCPNTSTKLLVRSSQLRNSRASCDGDTTILCPSECQAVSSSINHIETQPNVDASSKASLLKKTPCIVQGPKILREHVNFPFLTDNEVAGWIVNTRFMFILRGPPGSGKSYICECIRTRFPTAKVCSADEFWYLESGGVEYQFDISRVSEAHEWCQNRAFNEAQAGSSPLVIDNTNIRSWETRYYTDLARKFNYTVIMVVPQTPWRFDTETLAMRNVHFVGIEAIESKIRNFEYVFPLYYGWVWPGSPSRTNEMSDTSTTQIDGPGSETQKLASWPLEETQNLLDWGWDSLLTMVGLPDVRVQLASAFGLSDSASVAEIVQHWRSATIPEFGSGLESIKIPSVPHITAKYARFGRASGAEQYGLSGAVTESLLGKLFTVQVSGLFLSTRTVGARINLPADEMVLHHLWASDDQANLSRSGSSDHIDNVNGMDHPRRPIGCRAHVTLAVAPDVSAVETGLDLLRIVDAELAHQPGEHVAIVPGGSVRRVTVLKPALSPSEQNGIPHFGTAPPGREYMYVLDLDKPQHYRVLFVGAY